MITVITAFLLVLVQAVSVYSPLWLQEINLTQKNADCVVLMLAGLLIISVLCSWYVSRKKVAGVGVAEKAPAKEIVGLQDDYDQNKKEKLEAVKKAEEFRKEKELIAKQLKDVKEKSSESVEEREQYVDRELVNFLGLLQEKGRFVDFIMGDVSSYGDEQVGAAARAVHQGCSEMFKKYFEVAPVEEKKEGESVELAAGYSPVKYRLAGNVGEPPYKGTIEHHGWKVNKVNLPRVTDVKEGEDLVIVPAEVRV